MLELENAVFVHNPIAGGILRELHSLVFERLLAPMLELENAVFVHNPIAGGILRELPSLVFEPLLLLVGLLERPTVPAERPVGLHHPVDGTPGENGFFLSACPTAWLDLQLMAEAISLYVVTLPSGICSSAFSTLAWNGVTFDLCAFLANSSSG
eukprot:CAMPEP_0119573316 /NCGR_PEP_ID=MMETSP1352-20130426/45061_1 /TAXON_ID=265584 /ORGANISM="Stauroneis constricta, Strain CCMP1120" /LENGTH=153 /DNA_ID=CAMNT_0007623003 /DNA_START=236 /DNA_END=694 /DNA_ORIENTATION=-